MKKDKIINAKMFIVPNAMISLESQVNWETGGGKPGRISSTKSRLENIFGPLEGSEKLVQIWVFEDENSEDPNRSGNWSDHGRNIPEWDEPIIRQMKSVEPKSPEWNALDDKLYYNEWPTWLPLSKIRHLNDGDTLEVEWKGVTVRLVVDQLGTRYGSRTGNFRAALAKLGCY